MPDTENYSKHYSNTSKREEREINCQQFLLDTPTAALTGVGVSKRKTAKGEDARGGVQVGM